MRSGTAKEKSVAFHVLVQLAKKNNQETALKRANGNRTIAAQLPGITRQTIVKYTKENED